MGKADPVSRRRSETNCGARTTSRWLDRWHGTWSRVGTTDLSSSDRYALARELVTHAQALEPQNRKWADLMEGVKSIPSGSVPSVTEQAPAAATTAPGHSPRRRSCCGESTAVVAAGLPSDGESAGMQGTVKLQIRMGTDGHVKDASAISGDPLLIDAASYAAQRYVYKPTILNGQAPEVLTDVEIAFH